MCPAKSRSDLIEQLREVCVHVLHSGDGARLSALAVFHGTPKDRKANVKSFKTFVPKICGEQVRERHCCQMAKFEPFLSLDCARVEGV